MKFSEGDKVGFIYLGELKQGVVTERRASNFDISYQVKGEGMGTLWVTENELVAPAPVVKVPKIIGDFLENHSKEDGHTLHDLLCDLLTSRDSLDENVYDWIMGNNNENGDLLARAWLDGYEVEKKPLYYVRFFEGKIGFLNVYYNGSINVGSYDQCCGYKTKFTEAEIKEMDERYWQFAVPVEEVEGE
ncbi:DUF1642 domain-containing protein [Listeria sp. FSL L7-0083]|uniref:DUF1642 domain-containing protein n=1 Tax=Listeria farberi TaxID=2713500 RepID=UPI0016262E8D|nr:DUF1642 domain-containing protein [Listeria farberi]MBC2267686.1 DUF1642 domain-containing protein [Listeria farberi]